MPRMARADVRHLCIDTSSARVQKASCRRMVDACGMTCAEMRVISVPLLSLPRIFLYSFGKLIRKATIRASRRLNSGL